MAHGGFTQQQPGCILKARLHTLPSDRKLEVSEALMLAKPPFGSSLYSWDGLCVLLKRTTSSSAVTAANVGFLISFKC